MNHNTQTPNCRASVKRHLAALALGGLVLSLSACSDHNNHDATEVDGGASAPDGGAAIETVEVSVKQGKLAGKQAGATRTFLGIPYAEPPVGARRFLPPKPIANWEGTKQAFGLGASCPQSASALSAPGTYDEDCLTLNVYGPHDPSTKLPVMVWIYGGAFVSGGSNQYDAQRLASEGPVVVVTLNYRLGALGFMSLAALDAERAGVASGNDGLRDQQLALQWVQDNIASFGGDADNVTVFGESAGSMSTCLHMVSPTSRTLAKRFIMESGACVGGLAVSDKAAATAVAEKLVKAFCDGRSDVTACLREQDASDLVAYGASDGIFGAGWGPVADPADDFLPDLPAKLIAAGNYNKGDVILGTNKNEWGLFLLLGASPAITDQASLSTAINTQFGALAPQVAAHYTATDATAHDVFVRAVTDAAFRCPTRALARLISAQGSRTHLYSFEEGAAFHAFEIPYVFGTPQVALGAPSLVEPLRASVQSYWRAFASTGDPNVSGQPNWPAYDTAGDAHMTLQAEAAASSGLSKDDCDFWTTLAASTTSF
ncbi:MAG: hypothetical protein JWN04_4756 [Myxococcaceae bacterium]|nr:hypothetical protein [Myxococcaceae bacterium]